MKKVAIVFGALIALMLAAIVIIPMVVDVDKYRPQIQQVADDQLNGKLELGKLSLSLWGQIRIEIDGLKLTDSAGHSVVAVKDAWFHMPFLSLLGGSPELEFKMDSPELMVVKNKAGKLNVMTLAKGDQYVGAEALKTPQNTPAAKTAPNSGGGMALPALASSARLGFEIRNANLTYKDETTGLDSHLNGLNLVMKDLSVSHPSQIEFWSDIDTKMGKTMAIHGPVRMKAEIKPALSGGKFDHADFSGNFNADDLEIQMPGTFSKTKGMPANVDLALSIGTRDIKVEHLTAKFFNASLEGNGSIANISSGTAAPAEPVIRISLKSNEIELKPWVQLVPLLKDYQLGGTASLTAQAEGPSEKLTYEAGLKVTALTAKAPKLKAEPKIDVDVHVTTDKVDKLLLTMAAPANELKISGTVTNFAAPHADIQVSSTGMDLDQLVEFPPKGKPVAAAQAKEGEGTGQGSANAPKSDLDAELAPLRENKMMKEMAANVNFNLKSLKAEGVQMTDITGRIFLKNLTAGVDNLAMKLWNGSMKTSLSTDMMPAHPTYKFTAQASGLDLKEAVTSQVETFKNTVIGKASMEMTGEGSSYNTDAAIANLKAKGSFKIADAEFTTIDVGKMTTDALNSSIEKIGDKIPPLKGKHLNAPNGGKGTKYELMSATFTISGGKFSMPDFATKAAPNQGIDLKGATTVGMKDLSLDASWQVIDTYNITHAKDIALNGTPLLAEKGQPVKFPVRVTGTCAAPQYGYADVPEYLGKVALNNSAGAAKSALAQQVLKKAPAPVQNAAQGALKKLFGN
jgi:uncharacterized protein involved in outer membrane biogenesis